MTHLKTAGFKLVVLACLASAWACGSHSGSNQAVSVQATGSINQPVDFDALGLGDLISFDVYRDGDRIHALFAARNQHADRPFIGYVRSDDGGEHWQPATEITQNPALLALQSRMGNDVQIAAHGDTLMAVWQVGGEMPGMGPLVSLTSSDGGQHWTQGARPSAIDTDQSHPDLIADTGGRFHLVWLDDRDENGHQGLRYAQNTDDRQGWQQAQTLDDSSCSCCWNRLLANHDQQLFALYRDMEPRDMALAVSADGGQHWQQKGHAGAFDWHFDGCPHNGGALALSGSKTVDALVWTGAEQKNGLYHLKSTDNGASWSQPRRMGDATAFHADLVALDALHRLAVWDAMTDNGASIQLSLSSDGGASWSAARTLSQPAVSATFPRVVVSRYGWLILWQAQSAGGSRQWVSTLIKQ
ncbi:MAG: exo-alpha-sialidase [Methylomonas sp.]|nr:exo-alpha-sialidase [Methylomonas sp.]PPD22213.1 MAG: sialidase [Methylomonas sp.]PPD27750.1 MAG: sialidase [Methylomonas sp.]PPD39761.1 MAG: sialidase [Methylomonas sp.]PPD42534.1 MAG: sialidase [Methylomonas sp.]